MKEEIHPTYEEVAVRCACGNTFATRSTKSELRLEICSACHPFFTGRQKLIDPEGRVERFVKKFGTVTSEKRKAATKAAKEVKAKKAAMKRPGSAPVAATKAAKEVKAKKAATKRPGSAPVAATKAAKEVKAKKAATKRPSSAPV